MQVHEGKGRGSTHHLFSEACFWVKVTKASNRFTLQYFCSMFRWCSTCKDHNSLCMSTRMAGTSEKVLSYFSSYGKKLQQIEILYPNWKTEFWKKPNFLPLYWSENDIMTWWSQLPNTSKADFRSTRWHYSEVLIVLLAGSTTLKKFWFPYEILLLTKVIFPLQKG